MKTPATRTKQGEPAPLPRLRVRLRTADDVKVELARLYRDGKTRRRDVGDVSRLANVLQILARLIETSDLEARLAKLEESTTHDG